MKIAQKEEGFVKNWIQKISKSKNFEDDEDNEVRFKHNSINNNSSLNMVNYLASEHVRSLQQSPYIKIENDIKHVMKHSQHLKKATKNREELGITEDYNSKNMMLRFIQEDEVTQKNQMFLVFKAQFLAKIKQLEANKHCLAT